MGVGRRDQSWEGWALCPELHCLVDVAGRTRSLGSTQAALPTLHGRAWAWVGNGGRRLVVRTEPQGRGDQSGSRTDLEQASPSLLGRRPPGARLRGGVGEGPRQAAGTGLTVPPLHWQQGPRRRWSHQRGGEGMQSDRLMGLGFYLGVRKTFGN